MLKFGKNTLTQLIIIHSSQTQSSVPSTSWPMESPAHFLCKKNKTTQSRFKAKIIRHILHTCESCMHTQTCGKLKAMLPGATVWWVLTVKTNLWLGVVFTVTCLRRGETQRGLNFPEIVSLIYVKGLHSVKTDTAKQTIIQPFVENCCI